MCIVTQQNHDFINQSTNQATNQSNQSINRSINKSVYHSVNQFNQLVNQSLPYCINPEQINKQPSEGVINQHESNVRKGTYFFPSATLALGSASPSPLPAQFLCPSEGLSTHPHPAPFASAPALLCAVVAGDSVPLSPPP